MEHRYGRHGPRAWLRWYTRHYAQLQHTLVPVTRPQLIVIIQQEERILVIVLDENLNYTVNDDEGTASFTRPRLEITGRDVPQLTSGDRELENIARNQASIDAEEIEGISEESGINLKWDKTRKRVRTIARQHIALSLDTNEYERRMGVFQECYEQSLKEKIKGVPRIYPVNSQQEARLQEIARQDRETYPTYMSRPLHQRDLAILRVLTMLGLYAGDDDHTLFETIHRHADWYEDCFREQVMEVRDWPEPFRG